MIPVITKLFNMFSIANIITMIPAVLKKTLDRDEFFILNELKLMRDSTGNVPRANDVMVRAPLIKSPVERV